MTQNTGKSAYHSGKGKKVKLLNNHAACARDIKTNINNSRAKLTRPEINLICHAKRLSVSSFVQKIRNQKIWTKVY